VDRGATFLIIGASITRQFEFLQRVWVNDGDFVGLGAVKDPLIAANDGTGTFAIPRKPLRRRVKGLPRLVTTRAGEDCFLPGHPGAAMDRRRPVRVRPNTGPGPTLYDPRRTPASSPGRTPPTGPAAKVRVKTLTSGCAPG
jgi:hypothetical protein